MVKKVNKAAESAAQAAESALRNPAAFAESIKASAHNIYLAGLAQFSKAQQEGSKVFEGLVKEGLAVQRRTQAAAEERITEVTSRAAGLAQDVSAKASTQWSKLEDIFEERVARALTKMGVPTAAQLQALTERIDRLSEQASAKAKAPAKAKPAAKAPAKSPVKTPAKAPAKRTRTPV